VEGVQMVAVKYFEDLLGVGLDSWAGCGFLFLRGNNRLPKPIVLALLIDW
jgi:hypothetical protein